MAKGIEIGIASDTKAFKQGVEVGIIKPLDDATDALDDLGKSTGPAVLEDNLKEAQRATENLADDTKKTASTIEREFKDSYRSMKQNSDDATRGAKQNLDDIKGEAIANASETFASFDGSAESFADGIQGTLGGLVGSLPVVGAAAAGAAALAFGALRGSIEEDAKVAEERVSSMYQDFLASKGEFLSAAYLTDAVTALFDDDSKMSEIRRNVELTGLSLSKVTAAYAGDAQALGEVERALDKAARAQLRLLEAGKDYNEAVVVDARAGQNSLAAIAESTDTASAKAKAATEVLDTYGDKWSAADKKAAGAAATIDKIPSKSKKDVDVKLKVDDRDIDKALRRPRVIKLTIGEIVRSGKRAF